MFVPNETLASPPTPAAGVVVALERMPALLVVGCGDHSTETLLPAIASLGRARIKGVCDTEADRAKSLGRRFNVKRCGTDMHRMIDETRPDAVVLAGPPGMHTEGALHALDAGSHVLVEKPPAAREGFSPWFGAAAAAGWVIEATSRTSRSISAHDVVRRPGAGEGVN